MLASGDATQIRGLQRYNHRPNPIEVLRIQLEIGINCPDFKKAVDIVSIRDKPTLTFKANGPGDVLQQFNVKDIDIAIEVKASQSCDPASRGSYVQDIVALMSLKAISQKERPDDPLEAYFVLIDRNDEGYGEWAVGTLGRMIWETDAEQKIRLRRKGVKDDNLKSLRGCGLHVSFEKPLDSNLWIKCFVLGSTLKEIKPRYVSLVGDQPFEQITNFVLGPHKSSQMP